MDVYARCGGQVGTIRLRCAPTDSVAELKHRLAATGGPAVDLVRVRPALPGCCFLSCQLQFAGVREHARMYDFRLLCCVQTSCCRDSQMCTVSSQPRTSMLAGCVSCWNCMPGMGEPGIPRRRSQQQLLPGCAAAPARRRWRWRLNRSGVARELPGDVCQEEAR